MSVAFAATVSPAGMTVLTIDGRTVVIPRSYPDYDHARVRLKTIREKFAAGDEQFARTVWRELTQIADMSLAGLSIDDTGLVVNLAGKTTNAPSPKVKSFDDPVAVTKPKSIPAPADSLPAQNQDRPKPRKKQDKPKSNAGFTMPASLAALESAETMMRLGALGGSSYGFQTGIENYAQGAWGSPGLYAAMRVFRESVPPVNVDAWMAEYKKDEEAFMRSLYGRIMKSEEA